MDVSGSVSRWTRPWGVVCHLGSFVGPRVRDGVWYVNLDRTVAMSHARDAHSCYEPEDQLSSVQAGRVSPAGEPRRTSVPAATAAARSQTLADRAGAGDLPAWSTGDMARCPSHKTPLRCWAARKLSLLSGRNWPGAADRNQAMNGRCLPGCRRSGPRAAGHQTAVTLFPSQSSATCRPELDPSEHCFRARPEIEGASRCY